MGGRHFHSPHATPRFLHCIHALIISIARDTIIILFASNTVSFPRKNFKVATKWGRVETACKRLNHDKLLIGRDHFIMKLLGAVALMAVLLVAVAMVPVAQRMLDSCRR